MIQTTLGLFIAIIVPYFLTKIWHYFIFPQNYVKSISSKKLETKEDYQNYNKVFELYNRYETLYLLVCSCVLIFLAYTFSNNYPFVFGFSLSAIFLLIFTTYLNRNNFDEGKQIILLGCVLCFVLYGSLKYYS